MNDPAIANFSSRLRTARKMAGLSLEDLSGKIGGVVTRQAISKYEKGRMMPSREVLERLTETLAIKPDIAPAPEASYCLRESVDPYLVRTEPSSAISREPGSSGDIAGLALRRRFWIRRGGAPTSGIEPGLAQVRFREREKLPAKTAVALRLKVADYVKRCLEIESCLGIEHAFE
jgi:transcriptional regulator with XRE-family HTH domain